MNIPVTEAKAKFSEIIRRAEAGEEIVLTRNGKVVARMVGPANRRQRYPRLGAFQGQGWIADDFDELGPEWDEYIR